MCEQVGSILVVTGAIQAITIECDCLRRPLFLSTPFCLCNFDPHTNFKVGLSNKDRCQYWSKTFLNSNGPFKMGGCPTSKEHVLLQYLPIGAVLTQQLTLYTLPLLAY